LCAKTCGCPSDEAETTKAVTTKEPTKEPTQEPTKEPTKEPTEVPQAAETTAAAKATKEVSFSMKMSMSEDDFNTHKETIKEKVAGLLNTDKSKVKLALKAKRRRRLDGEHEVEIDVTVEAEDDAAATAIEDVVKGETFADDLATDVSSATSLTVTVSDVSEPVSRTLEVTENTTTDDDDDNNTTMIIIIVVVAVAVLAIGGFICYTMSNNQKLKKEMGGEDMTENETKRTPGSQA